MLLSHLIESLKNELEITNFKDIEIRGVESDSRLVEKDFMFFALRGKTNNAIEFVDEVIKKGVVAIVCGKDESFTSDKVTVIKHENPREFMGIILGVFYPERPSHIMAVTGTSGKTSTVEFVRQALEEMGLKSASIGTLGVIANDYLHRQDTLTMREPVELRRQLNFLKKEKGVDYVVMEATSQGMDQSRMSGLGVELAAFTNLTPEHLDYHRDMEDYFETKMILFRNIMKRGVAVLNADIPEYERLLDICKKEGHRIVSFGHKGETVRIISTSAEQFGQTAIIGYNGGEYVLKTEVIGEFQIMNLVCALAMIAGLGIEKDFAKIVAATGKAKAAEGRMELAGITKNGASVYIDFAHTADGMEKALGAIRAHMNRVSKSGNGKAGRLISLFGCGGDRDPTKRPPMGEVASDMSDYVIISDDNPRSEDPANIRKQVLAACGPETSEIADREIAIQKGIDMLEPGDVLFIMGKGHQKYHITKDGQHYFNEFEIVQDHINSKK